MKRGLSLGVAILVLAVSGCSAAGKPAGNELPVAQVAKDVRSGAARAFDDCTWYPGAAGFSAPPEPAARPLGQLVLREDALLWGQYDMAQSVFKVARRIPFNQIKTFYLARKEGRRMLVLESANGALDSFAIERPASSKDKASEHDAAATEEVWRTLRNMLAL